MLSNANVIYYLTLLLPDLLPLSPHLNSAFIMPQPKKQKRPARITSFPFFPRLPLELQDEIWKFALGNDTPAAHIITIGHAYSPPAPLHLQRLVATGYSS